MFGARTIGVRDVVFDSREEAQIAEHLEALLHERVVAGYLVHPVVSGFTADFLVQLGDRATAHRGSLIVVEYDGLGTARRGSLLPRVTRYQEMAPFGFLQAWPRSASQADLIKALESPEPPHLIKKILVCPKCGAEDTLYVIGEEDFSEPHACSTH